MFRQRRTLFIIILVALVAGVYVSTAIYQQVRQLIPEISTVSEFEVQLPTPTASTASTVTIAGDDAYSAGQTLFAQNCTACHGISGEGSSIAPALNAPEVRQMDRKTLQDTITFGRPGTAMPAWGINAGGVLGAEEIGELVSLIRAGAWQQSAPVAVAEENFTGIPPQAVSLFSQNCAVCHGATGDGTGIAPPLNSSSLHARMTIDALESTIRNGRPGTRMPAWGGLLSQSDITALATLIRHWDSLTPAQLQQMAQSQPSRFGGMGGRRMMGGGMMGGRGMMGR